MQPETAIDSSSAYLARPKIVYWTNAPAPYTVDRFNAVASRGVLDFEAWFEARTPRGRDWDVAEGTWRFPYRLRPSLSSLIALRFSSKRPDLLVALYYMPRMLIGAAWFRRTIAISYCLDGPGDGWARKRAAKEQLKRAALTRADSVFCAGPETVDFAAGYGVARSRCFELPHSIDTRYLQAEAADVARWRRALRSELGLDGLVFLYVGRLWRGKGIDALLEALAQSRARGEKVHLLLVGSGVDADYYRDKAAQLGLVNVHWVGFAAPQDLIRYYAASDVFVFPSLGDPYGLVVDEAMAMGLPVIGSAAAGEMRTRVQDGRNGFVVGAGDSAALARAMQTFVDAPDLARAMGAVSAAAMQGRDPEHWAVAFESCVRATLSMGERK